jgi:WD40 repeat protein
VGSSDDNLSVWDALTYGTAVASFPGHSNSVGYATFTRDGMRIVFGAEDKVVGVWDSKRDRQQCCDF